MPSYQFKLNGQPIRGGAIVEGDAPGVVSCESDHPIGWFSVGYNSGDPDGNRISAVSVGANEWRYENPIEFGYHNVRCMSSAKDGVPGGSEGGWIEFQYVRRKPSEKPQPVRADTIEDVRKAIASGAKHIQTTGFTLSDTLDAQGATIELLPGGEWWKPAVTLTNKAALVDAIIQTPPTVVKDNKPDFRYGIAVDGIDTRLMDVTFADNAGFCIHMRKGSMSMLRVRARRFSEYFVYQEPGTKITASICTVVGGSQNESVWRTAGGRMRLDSCTLDNSQGGKAAIRGDSPSYPDGAPGCEVYRCTIVGQFGSNPLTEDDGGQMFGIDRWRVGGNTVQFRPESGTDHKPEAIAFARTLVGQSVADIAKATYAKWMGGVLSNADAAATAAHRKSEIERDSSFIVEDSDITGDIRINARTIGTVRRTVVKAVGNATPLNGNLQPQYPWPIDRVLDPNEVQPAARVVFEGVSFVGPSLGIKPADHPGIRFERCKLNGAPIVAVLPR